MSKAVHVKSKRRAFYKVKREEVTHTPAETVHICAIDLSQMSNAMLAFYKVAHKRNNFKPDGFTRKHPETVRKAEKQAPPVRHKLREQRVATRSSDSSTKASE